MHPLLEQGLRQRIFWITRRLAIGQFATEERAQWLLEQGVTHVLNVGEGTSVVAESVAGFREVIEVPIEDLARIPDAVVIRCLKIVHDVMLQPDSKLYIHCIAGQNRSPTILWLYFVACGLSEEVARQMITLRSPDSVPGHGKLVDASLVVLVRRFGENNFLPPREASILKPAY
jgi:Swiss Army Knife protein, DSP-PTPase phosphatase domain